MLVTSTEDEAGTTIRISNTGVRVDLSSAERWFEPYATTTAGTDPFLGQGTGLGLTITRSLVMENAGTVAFVTPPPGYQTCVEVHFARKGAPARLRPTRDGIGAKGVDR